MLFQLGMGDNQLEQPFLLESQCRLKQSYFFSMSIWQPFAMQMMTFASYPPSAEGTMASTCIKAGRVFS